MSDDLARRLDVCWAMLEEEGFYTKANTVSLAKTRIEELEDENQKLRKALKLYQRERDRFKHTHPEMTGAYFLTGGHGPKDENGVPMYVEICPAYGCGWTYVYQTTGRTISYEGS